MGLSVSITVQRQDERYGSEGYNPKGTNEEIEEAVKPYFHDVFSNDLPFHFEVRSYDDRYIFHVEFYRYGANLKEEQSINQVYLGFMAYILDHFSTSYGIKMSVDWSG